MGNVYDYDELSEDAKNRAVNDLINFWMNFIQYEKAWPKLKKAFDKAEAMRTPWFTGAYVWDYCKEEVLAELRGLEFLKTGEYHGNKEGL